jgi:class 3 adenylate cyclase
MRGRERQRFQHALQGSVGPAELERLLKEEHLLFPTGAKRRASLLSLQLTGYAGPQGDAGAPQVVATLREWQAAMAAMVHAEAGRFQRVLGHAALATFGEPLPQPEHAAKAVGAAMSAQAETARLAQGWAQHGLEGVQLRAAIATGDVLVGDVGDDAVADYVLVGPTLDLVELLVARAPPGGALVSEDTRRACIGRYEFQAVPGFEAKGRPEPVQPFLLIGPKLETDPERSGARLPANADVLVRTAAQTAAGRVDNVSAGGLHVSTVLALRVGDPVEVEFAPVPELTGAAPVIVRGQIRHLRPAEDGSPGFGMVIDRADSLTPEALRHFVALYFPGAPAHPTTAAEGSNFYRLELGESFFKLLHGDPPAEG